MKTRREFLTVSAGSAALLGFSSSVPQALLRAAESKTAAKNDNVLVVIQLSGGNDGLNTIVPYADDIYQKNRFSLALGEGAVRKIDDYQGFHPDLENCSKLLESGELSIIHGVGYPNPNRSHFESMDLWHTAHRKTAQVESGWLGRVLDNHTKAGSLPGIHLGREDRPLALASNLVQVPSVKALDQFQLKLGERHFSKAELLKSISAPRETKNSLLDFVQSSTQSAIATSTRIEKIASKMKENSNYPQTTLARKLSTVAQLISAGLETSVYYITIDGFDTHSNQGPAHAGLLREVDRAVGAFMNDIREQGNSKRVLGMVFSEFGRRLKENASQGTDHGAAAPVVLFGGKLKSGLHGKYPELDKLDDGDLRFHTDYRQIYATILEDWLNTSSHEILGSKHKKLDLIG